MIGLNKDWPEVRNCLKAYSRLHYKTGGCGVLVSYKLCSMRFCNGHILLSLSSDKVRQSFVLLAVLENLKAVLAGNSRSTLSLGPRYRPMNKLFLNTCLSKYTYGHGKHAYISCH